MLNKKFLFVLTIAFLFAGMQSLSAQEKKNVEKPSMQMHKMESDSTMMKDCMDKIASDEEMRSMMMEKMMKKSESDSTGMMEMCKKMMNNPEMHNMMMKMMGGDMMNNGKMHEGMMKNDKDANNKDKQDGSHESHHKKDTN